MAVPPPLPQDFAFDDSPNMSAPTTPFTLSASGLTLSLVANASAGASAATRLPLGVDVAQTGLLGYAFTGGGSGSRAIVLNLSPDAKVSRRAAMAVARAHAFCLPIVLQPVPGSALAGLNASWALTLWAEATAVVNSGVAAATRPLIPGSGFNATRYSITLLGA